MGDVRHAFRTVRRHPALAFVVILMFATGIGAATAVFSLVNGVLLRSLPFRDPDRIVWMYNLRTERDRAPLSIPDLEDYRRDARTVAALAPFTNWTANLTGAGEAERLEGVRVAGNFFELVGAVPQVGRTLMPTDEDGDTRRVVLTEGLWGRRFGRDPSIVGKSIDLNGVPHQVVGILSPTFVFPFRQAELAVPLSLRDDPRHTDRGANFLRVVARLEPNVTIAQAKADLDAIAARLQRDYPLDDVRKVGISLYPLHAEIVRDYSQILWTLFATVAVLLLIGCGNVANLLLVRATRRQAELAVRAALGASRGRLARILMIESAMLAIPGAVLGTAFAAITISVWPTFAPADFPRLTEVSLNASVLAFSAVVSVLVAIVCGIVPAWTMSRDPGHVMAEGSRTVTGSAGHGAIRRSFVALQLAGTTLLLIFMGLQVRSLSRLEAVDPGFTTDEALSVQLSLPPVRYNDAAAIARFHDALKIRVDAIPGVRAAGAISLLPLSGLLSTMDIAFPDRAAPAPDEVPQAHFRIAGPGYFEAAGVRVIEGRGFTDADSRSARRVAIVSETLTRRHWPGESAVGKHLQLVPALPSPLEVVGVVADVQQFGIDQNPTADLYLPLHQMPSSQAPFLAARMFWVVRADATHRVQPDSVRRAIGDVDPDVATSSVRTLDEVRAATLASRRANLRAVETFSEVALVLAAFGVYAVTTFSAGSRRREIAIRMAFGASRRDVERLMVTSEIAPALAGVIAGFAVALAAGPMVSGTLFATSTRDPLVFGIVIAGLGSVAVLANYLAIIRAGRVEPADLLRA